MNKRRLENLKLAKKQQAARERARLFEKNMTARELFRLDLDWIDKKERGTA